MKPEDKFYIDLVGQIIDGFSTIEWGGHLIYIRHHDFRSQALISSSFEKYKKENISLGIPTEEQAIKEAMQRGDWTQEDEDYIRENESKIEALTNAAKAMKIPSHKEKQMALVVDLKKKIAEKKSLRNDIVINSAENRAYSRANNRFIEVILFKDKDFKEPFTEGEDCSSEDFVFIRNKQIEIYNTFNEDNIARAVLRDFFSMFMSFSESPMDFFGKPVTELSVFQLKLITYAKMFRNIFENVKDIPDLIKYDPDAIIEFVKVQQEEGSKEHVTRGHSDPAARTYFGANKDDLEKLKGSGEQVVSLGQLVKKHGGSMNMEQMMKAHGL